MPDETPDETSSEPTAADDVTETDADATEVSETTEPQPAVDGEASDEAADEPVAASTNGDHRPGVFIPRGVAILLGVLLLIGVVGGGGFALGRSTADDDGDRERSALPFGAGGGNGPQGQNNGNGNGNGGAPGNDGRDLPFGDNQPTPVAGAFLGVRIDDATGDTSGAEILLVASASPAADAGLEPGDVITQVDGDEILGADDLVAAIADHDPGDTVTITFLRDGDTESVEVELADPLSAANRSRAQPSPAN